MGISVTKVKSLAGISCNLSHNARNALARGSIVGIITAVIYLAVVVITTPNLPPSMSIGAALKVNGLIIIGLAIGVGMQVFALTYGKGLGCRLDETNKYDQQRKDVLHVFRSWRTDSSGAGAGASGGTVMSSFLSFFSLVPLGCCGSWLFILSMLPSIFGGTVSVILIEYSILLSYVGLVIVLCFAGVSILRVLEWTNSNREIDENKSKTTSTLERELEGRGDGRF